MTSTALPRLHRRIATALHHRWLDERDAQRAVPPDLVERLRTRVAASERRHTGQIRICVESSLPSSYLWRHVYRRVPMAELARQRALMLFSKLHVWDTEHNNGVLIYLLLASHRIELVADRSLQRCSRPGQWEQMVAHLGSALEQGRMEDGLTSALEEVSAVLVQHFPRDPDAAGDHPNELPDRPVLLG